MAVGYIGLGSMGAALAARLLRKNPLYVYDQSPNAMQAVAAAGATACTSPAEVAALCDVIFLCLPTSDHVRTVIFGDSGIATTAKPGTLVIDQTTGDPGATLAVAAEMAARELFLIDAPVSAGPEAAEAGTIAIMVGATPDQYASAYPLLRTISSNVFHAGDPGAGHIVKLAKNLLSAGHRLLTLEAFTLAVKNGLDPQKVLEILLASSGRNFFLEHSMGQRILSGNLVSGSTLGQLYKDVKLACDLGAGSDVPMPFGGHIKDLYRACIDEMGTDAQVNTAALVIDRLAGTQIVPQDS